MTMVVLWYVYDSPTSRLYVGYTTTIGLQEHYVDHKHFYKYYRYYGLSMVVLWYAYDSSTSRLYVGYTTTIGLQEHYESAISRLYIGYNSTTGALHSS